MSKRLGKRGYCSSISEISTDLEEEIKSLKEELKTSIATGLEYFQGAEILKEENARIRKELRQMNAYVVPKADIADQIKILVKDME